MTIAGKTVQFLNTQVMARTILNFEGAMENQDIRTLRLLEAVEEERSPSQRELARKLEQGPQQTQEDQKTDHVTGDLP